MVVTDKKKTKKLLFHSIPGFTATHISVHIAIITNSIIYHTACVLLLSQCTVSKCAMWAHITHLLSYSTSGHFSLYMSTFGPQSMYPIRNSFNSPSLSVLALAWSRALIITSARCSLFLQCAGDTLQYCIAHFVCTNRERYYNGTAHEVLGRRTFGCGNDKLLCRSFRVLLVPHLCMVVTDLHTYVTRLHHCVTSGRVCGIA